MLFLINLLLAVLAYLAVKYLMGKFSSKEGLNVVVAVLVGLLVFLANLANEIVN